jgi:hypothetical protein
MVATKCGATSLPGNESLPGAHLAIADARAQSTIVAENRFWEYIDRPVSMVAVEDVWAAKRKNRDIRNEELKRKVPTGWTEGKTGSAWKLPWCLEGIFICLR